MRKNLLFFLLILTVCSCKKGQESEITLLNSHTFSVAKNLQVKFATGNLQYQPSTKTWRFAQRQCDVIGDAKSGNVADADNLLIAPDYDGWIDLFGWGTSGCDSGAVAFEPYSTSTLEIEYYPGGEYANSLIDAYANCDWGVYNALQLDDEHQWRTLTVEEYTYLLTQRDECNRLYSRAMVDSMCGLVLLPDNCFLSDTLFVPVAAHYTDNVYNLERWQLLEKEGAVFLPAAGARHGKVVGGANYFGAYWSVNATDSLNAYSLRFDSVAVNAAYVMSRANGQAVRLAYEVK